MNNEYRPGFSPLERAKDDPGANLEDAQWRTIEGLEVAIAATEKSIAESNMPVYHEHLENLRSQLISTINQSIEQTQAKITALKTSGGDVSSLEWHRNNLYDKLNKAQGRSGLAKAA